MYRIIPALVATSLAVSGAAFAQNAGNGSNTGLTTGAAPGIGIGAVTPGVGPSSTPPTVGTAVGGGISPSTTPMDVAPTVGTSVGSQRQTHGLATLGAATTPSGTIAVPVPGANSFTMGQARSRLQRNGYTQVTGLHKDSQGIWRGKAMKNGQSTDAALDYQGNVSRQ